jgi:23S rRNA pseudouridine1911/1915/1917 synthase
VHKTYLALATGAPERAFTVEAPVASRRGRRRVDVGHGQPAETSIRVLKQYRDAALVAAETRHGRRHQIRAHLAHAGHPLVADELYGGRPLVQEAGLSLPSPLPLPLPLLHAAALELPHPAPPHARVTHGEDLPGALQQALARLARR